MLRKNTLNMLFKMLKELKEAMSKEPKKSMRTISHLIEIIIEKEKYKYESNRCSRVKSAINELKYLLKGLNKRFDQAKKETANLNISLWTLSTLRNKTNKKRN